MAAFTRTIYTEPPTFLGMLLDCTQYVDRCRHDPTCSKEDVLDSMENRLSLLVGKMAAYPTSASFQVLLDPPATKPSAAATGSS
jgi:hypothetical protein